MSLTVHVRVFVPGENTPGNSVGHYDMIVEGNHIFNGVELANPVFSYRRTSELQVFEEASSSNFYDASNNQYYHDCSIYKWTFVLSQCDCIQKDTGSQILLKQQEDFLCSGARRVGSECGPVDRRAEPD